MALILLDAVKAEMAPCTMLSVLMGLIDSPNKAIAKASVICIGLSLPNGAFDYSSSPPVRSKKPNQAKLTYLSSCPLIADNLTEIIRLGCIDAFLKLMTPINPNADAVMYALSLIADETDAIFPKEVTIVTSLKMLETLRGAAKRSKNASAMGFLFAALSKSHIFHTAICSEANLSILSKLLVGGSPEVLCSTAYALGIVAMNAAQDSVKELLFRVDAPQNLLKLLSTSSSDKVTRLAIFALACTLHEGLVLSVASGRAVYPEFVAVASESSSSVLPLRANMLALCGSLLKSQALVDLIYDRAVLQHFTGSTYAFKVLACLSLDARIRLKCCNPLCIQRMLWFTRSASSSLLATCLAFFIECTTDFNNTTSRELQADSGDSDSNSQASVSDTQAFCLGLEQQSTTTTTDDGYLSVFVALFTDHAPDRLVGLAVLLSNFVKTSASMKVSLSTKSMVDSVLITVTRLNNTVLHDQVLRFLIDLTQCKNDTALQILFESDPDRVANLLHAAQHPQIQLAAATLLRRMFKRLNAPEVPSTAAKRHLVKLMSNPVLERRDVAIAACRVWGNLFLYEDKRVDFSKSTNAVEVMLRLLSRCIADNDCREPLPIDSERATTTKNLHVAIRSVYRACRSDEVKKIVVSAPHFLCIVDLFAHSDERIAHLAITTMTEIARCSAAALRKHVAVAAVLTKVNTFLRDRDQRTNANVFMVAKLDCLDLLSALAKKEPGVQHLLVEYKILDAVVLLLHSPLTTLDWELLCQCLETLAWMASGSESPVRKLIATSKMVDLALRHVDSSREQVTSASLHLLQRLSGEPEVKEMVKSANGPSVIMRALSNRNDSETRTRACSLIRNLVSQHDANRKQFQSLGANSYLVTLVVTSSSLSGSCQDLKSALKLRIKGLYAISAMVEGVTALAKTSKQEVVECEDSLKLVRLVSLTDDRRLCAAWCYTLAMLAHGSSLNQKKLVDASGLIELLVKFVLNREFAPLRVFAAQLLAYLASFPENRPVITKDGGDELLLAIIDALQATELHDLQRFTALFVANLVTRNDDNKVRIGASGAIAPLIDRLSSKQLNVLENVLHAIMKLGSHAGNKVKFGSRVGFEKLLALVHHDELAIRKSAVSTIAVLIEGNDVNKKFLLQCEASVVTELCALMKSTNGKVIESAMLILGELSLLPDQTLEISKYIDILVIVRMMEHVNVKIRRAALTTVMNLTKESFNKLRFGIRECIDALLLSLKSDDLLIVELAISCLANLSFTTGNASQIAQSGNAITVLLKLAAASTTSKDYLTWKEAHFLRLDKHNSSGNPSSSPKRSPQKEAAVVPPSLVAVAISGKVDERRDGDEIDEADWSDTKELSVYSYCGFGDEGQSEEVLDFSSFPSRQTSVLEQTLLILSNCAEEFHDRKLVEKVAIKVICQTVHHPSELVKRCACFILGFWCKKDPVNQEIASTTGGGIGILPTLIQLLNSPNLNIVEAAMYALCKLAYFGDNHAKMLSLDLLTTLVQGILRRPGNLTHDGLLDRSLRLLGTLVTFSKVRQVVKSEEIISDILTNLLQIHKDALAKNISRLMLVMLEEESLRFFLPKKTVMLLRAIFTDETTSAKTVRNILRIFKVIAQVEEHKTTIALEDSGEALGKMVHELHVEAEMEENLMQIPASAPNADTILHLLAGMSSTKRIAAILFDKKIYTVLPLYLVPFEAPHIEEPSGSVAVADTSLDQVEHLEMNVNAVVITKHLCTSQGNNAAIATFSNLEFTQFLLNLLRNAMELADYKLSRLSFECLVILDKLCKNTNSVHDQQVLYQEAAVDVFAFYLELWLHVIADSNRLLSLEDKLARKPGFLKCNALGSIEPLEFIVPLAQLFLSLTTHQENRTMQVHKGCMMLLLQAMSVSTLSNDLRLCFVKTFASLSELPASKDFFDRDNHVSPLFRFMFAHEANAELLLYSLRSFASIMARSPASRHHILSHAPALSFLLECLADAQSDNQDSKVYFAILSLECLSMEKEIALRLAPLEALSLVPKLLLLPIGKISRETQYFATEMIGYMALFGHADKLQLQEPMVARILSFAAFESDELITTSSIKLALWSLAQLAKSTLSSQICKWIVQEPRRLDVLIKCGLVPPQSLGVTSVVVGYALSILIQIVDVDEVVSTLVAKRICTPLSLLLEAVEQDLRLSALKILSLLLPRYGANELTSASTDDGIERKEDWGAVLRHLVEWMEVYARDLAICSIASLEDAYASLSFLLSLDSVIASEFQTGIARTGIAEIVANTMAHFDYKTKEMLDGAAAGISVAGSAQKQEPHERILLYALNVCFNLMGFSSTYTDRFVELGAPATMENILHLQSHELQLETLKAMNHLANLSVDSHLQFASFRCVTRLKQLAQNATTSLTITAKVTPLLALMAKKLPSLPGLCCLDGIDVISNIVLTNWTSAQRSELQLRITEDGCEMLLAMYASDENVFALYDQTKVITKLFEIVVKHGAPELPLRVLVKISEYTPSHPRFMSLLPALCRLLLGDSDTRLGSGSHNLILTILFNIFCRGATDQELFLQALAIGENAVLPQVLPLARWAHVSNPGSVEIVLKLLYAYTSTANYKMLFNDGANIPSLLELVAVADTNVAVAAAQLLLCVSEEREVQISITVEDGIGSLVRSLQRTTHWTLQCLILTILRNMSPDSEIQVLILNENGVVRLIEFVKERKGMLFTTDERLGLCCEILRLLAHSSSAAGQLVAAHGHTSLVELNRLQLANKELDDDGECEVTLEILSKLTRVSLVVLQLIDVKLHELYLKYVLPSSGCTSSAKCTRLAFAGLRSLCQENREIRGTLGSKEELIPLLEANLSQSQTDGEATNDSLALLQYLSKTPDGRKSIFTKSSRVFIETLCALIVKASSSSLNPSSKPSSSATKTPTTTSPVSIMGVKLIANLLTDISQERFRVSWQYNKLLTLSPLLEVLLANHQQPKLQLKALLVLSGSFLGGSFYYQLSPQMLSDLLNILLISASKQHCELAEDVVVHAFDDRERVRASIGGNQILEQLLIVVTQKTNPAERWALGSALTEALYVSIAQKFVVNQRFLSKILSLLTSSAVSSAAGASDDSVVVAGEEDKPLMRALCIYLSFVFKIATQASALQNNIREVLRSEVNATAFEAITDQVLALHPQSCTQTSSENKAKIDPSTKVSFSKHLLLWNLFAECLAPPVQHVQRILNRVELSQWLCCVDDFFSAFRGWDSNQPRRSMISTRESTSESTNRNADDDVLLAETTERPTVISVSSISYEDAMLATFKVASVLTRLVTPSTDSEDSTADVTTLSNRKQTVCTWCLETLWEKADSLDKHHALVEAALTALLDIRDGWGENCLLVGYKSYTRMDVLLVKLLPIFHSPYRALNQSRHLLLQLLLTLVSTGSFIDELKNSDIQSAIENNELIAAADKALPITILSMLGYNADLNSEFALALDRCASAENASTRKENLAYLVNFLQLYAITDESLQQRAISVFMKELVARAGAVDVENDDEELSSAITRSCVVGLVKISGVRKFVDLYLHEWTLNALLGVAFARMKGDQCNDFQERASLSSLETNQLLEITTRICNWLGSPTASTTSSAGSIDEQNLVNALTLVQSLSRQELPLVEQLIELLSWLLQDAECFQFICLHAPMLKTFFLFLLELSDDATGLLLGLLERCIHNAPRIDDLNELLSVMLAFVYTNAAKLSKSSFVGVRDKLLLYILLIMKRLGEEGLSGSEVYEHAIQLILANIKAMGELEARVSWNLLGMLTEFDPAIVTIFNFDGIKMLLHEFCVVPQQLSRANSSSSSLTSTLAAHLFQMEALKCLSKSARTHDDVLFKIGETTGIGAILFTVLANAASGNPSSSQRGVVVVPAANIGESQEHASHLIARISYQEYLRASLLSQDHVSILIESMESVHLKVVLHSLEALSNLCEFAMCLDALVRHATVPVLGQILFSPLAEGETQKKTEEFVLGILGSMCSKSKLICRRVVSSNLVPKLNLYLSSSRTSVHHNATWVINCLSKDAELVPKLRDHGVLETLCDKMLDYDPRTTQCKALGALANLVALSRISIVTSDEALARAIVGVTVESINRNIPNLQAQHAIAKGLSVFEAIAVQGYEAKSMLYEDNAIPITSALLGAPDAEVRLKALHVTTKWVEENHEVEQIRELFSDAILLNLVRAISEETGEMLLVALALLNTLLTDDVLKEKLTSMTYEVLLRLVVTHTSQSVTTAQSKVLVESLKALAAMTKSGKLSVSTSSEIINSVEPLILLLQTSPSDSIRIDSLYLLVNFASATELRGSMLRCGMLQALVVMLGSAVQLRDEQVVQLSLLGMALLTAIDFSDFVADLAGATVETLVGLLSSRNPNIQANAVWVLSNISSEGQSAFFSSQLACLI